MKQFENRFHLLTVILLQTSCFHQMFEQLKFPEFDASKINIKLNGYYYYPDKSLKSDCKTCFPYYHYCFFSNDGTFYTNSHWQPNLTKLDSFLLQKSNFQTSSYSPVGFGGFNVQKKEISIQYYAYFDKKDMRRAMWNQRGQILNDSTFVIKELVKFDERFGKNSNFISDTFKFRFLPTKPDSVAACLKK
jgi:hypothetical protein